MKSKKISFKTFLTIILLPLLICIAILVFLTGFFTMNTYKKSQSLYYDTLYNINTSVLEAEKSFYRAMFTTVQFQILQITHETGGQSFDELVDIIITDHNDATESTIASVSTALEIAKNNPDLYENTYLEDGTTFAMLGEMFNETFSEWNSAYDLKTGAGSFPAQQASFFVAIEYLNNIQQLTEQWAASKDADFNNEIMMQTLIITIVFAAIFVCIVILVIVFLKKLINNIKDLTNSISMMSDGDFISSIENNQLISEFDNMAVKTEQMRNNLKASLLKVINLANSVSEGAIETEERINDSQKMTSDINQAVGDLADGATSMAQDVQSTSSMTLNIGESVNSVYDSTNSNSKQGAQVYENASNVKELLDKLKEAEETTDNMASQVADSVQKTADVVDKISAAADAIIGIASQTNLLALNASIEAARAGESGKGFAVVADNIKNLAEESDSAAKDITDMLSVIVSMSKTNEELTGKIKEATQSEATEINAISSAFNEMLDLLEKTEAGNKNIIRLVNSLNSDKDSVMGSVESLSAISEENAASTEETSASLEQLNANMIEVVNQAKNLQNVAIELQKSIEFFKVK